ncbi:MAG: VOC family protein, partial [Phaeodactylibacter sp.]|nr:VOC family protein [Phaeodactylibacter sp.]
QFQFTEAISMVVNCRDQAEIDYYWERLSAGGSEGRCGWLKDRYGLSWQVVPTILATLMGDPGKAPFVVAAFMKMNKFILADLLQAAENS